MAYQNDCFAADGMLRGIVGDTESVDACLAITIRLLQFLADTEALLISVPMILPANFRALAESEGVLDTLHKAGALRAGSRGAETIPQVRAFGNRITHLSGKQAFNAFSHTDLDRILWERNISRVVLTGMMTSLCVDSTARASYERGYRTTVVADCVCARTADEQRFYCETVFPLYADVVDGAGLIEQLSARA
jgi:nicotinamidase-related amidase